MDCLEFNSPKAYPDRDVRQVHAKEQLPGHSSNMRARGPNNEWKRKHILKFHEASLQKKWGTCTALPLPRHMINVNINIPSKTISNFFTMFIYIPYQKFEMGWRLTVALVVSWQNKVGDRQRGDGRRKQTMNNLRVMPRDLSTSFVLPLI